MALNSWRCGDALDARELISMGKHIRVCGCLFPLSRRHKRNSFECCDRYSSFKVHLECIEPSGSIPSKESEHKGDYSNSLINLHYFSLLFITSVDMESVYRPIFYLLSNRHWLAVLDSYLLCLGALSIEEGNGHWLDSWRVWFRSLHFWIHFYRDYQSKQSLQS